MMSNDAVSTSISTLISTSAIVNQPDRMTWEGDACLLPEILYIGWGRFMQAQPGSLGPSQHPAYEICYIVQGQVAWWILDDLGDLNDSNNLNEETVYEVNRGDLFITKPGETHGGLDNTMHPCEIRWIQVCLPEDGTPLPGLSVAETEALARDFRSIHHRCFAGSAAIKRNLTRILVEHQAPSSYAIPLLRSYLHQLLIQVLQAHTAHSQVQANESIPPSHQVHQAIQWLETHLTETYHIEDLAQIATMSVSQFHKLFLKETGFTPAEYRTRKRLQKAKQLLGEGEQSILTIAQSLGFSTSQYFANVFKKFEGVSPSQYRARCRFQSSSDKRIK